MQNKQSIVGLVAAAVIIFGAGMVYLYDKAKPEEPNRTVAAKVTPAKSTVAGTIVDVLKTTDNKKCTYTTPENGTQGTFYLTTDKAYGTLVASESGQNQTTYVLRDGDSFYVWGDSLPTGIKLTMTLEEVSENLSTNPYASSFNVNQKVDYSCSKWTPDTSLFTPPTNIRFTDIGTSKIPSATGPKSINPSSQCSLCSSMTGQARSTCLASFNCQ